MFFCDKMMFRKRRIIEIINKLLKNKALQGYCMKDSKQLTLV